MLVLLGCINLCVGLTLGADTPAPEKCSDDLGMESGEIKDTQLSASSSFDAESVGPQHGRIRIERRGGAWCPKQMISPDVYEWLQIDLLTLHRITIVETQGRFGNGQGAEYAEQFTIQYQGENGEWKQYRNSHNENILQGNTNTYVAVMNKLDVPVIATKIRFIPVSSEPRTVCMRVELYGCNLQCAGTLGMESGEITDSQLSASSSYDIHSVGPNKGRIRTEDGGGAWCPQHQISPDVYEWLQIDLVTLHKITSVETQGRFGNGQGFEYAEQFMLQYQGEDEEWKEYRSSNGENILQGNTNTYLSVLNELDVPIVAKKIRFVPVSSEPTTVCMRVELYGCNWQCAGTLGMESGEITDVQLSASSSYDTDSVGPQNARIRTEYRGGAWCPQHQISPDVYEWLQIDLLTLHKITNVETQGRFGNGQGYEYAERFMLQYHGEEEEWKEYRRSNGENILQGNTNTYLAVMNELDVPIIASKIRFVPVSSEPKTVCMRVELYGCNLQ